MSAFPFVAMPLGMRVHRIDEKDWNGDWWRVSATFSSYYSAEGYALKDWLRPVGVAETEVQPASVVDEATPAPVADAPPVSLLPQMPIAVRCEAVDGKWFAKIGDERLLVGSDVRYGDHRRGLKLIGSNDVPRYDPARFRERYGVWADMVGVTAHAEGSGDWLAINTYDTASFTFGLLQWAAHTQDDNFVLLLRRLLALPSAKVYFPDLRLDGGKVHQVTPTGGLQILETKKNAALRNYLNPDPDRVGEQEARVAGKLVHWFSHMEEARAVLEDFTFWHYMERARDVARGLQLQGQAPIDDAAMVVAVDIRHQGRATYKHVQEACRGRFSYENLLQVGAQSWGHRLDALRGKIEAAIAEGRLGRHQYDAETNSFVPIAGRGVAVDPVPAGADDRSDELPASTADEAAPVVASPDLNAAAGMAGRALAGFVTKVAALPGAVLDFLLDQEVGSRAKYEENLQSPSWPGAGSGLKIGFGYDMGAVTAEEFREDWGRFLPAAAVEQLSAYCGRALDDEAGPDQIVAGLSEIRVPFEAAMEVHRSATLPKQYAKAVAAFPHFGELEPRCKGALLSLVANVGGALDEEGDARAGQLRNIRDYMRSSAFAKIPRELRSMGGASADGTVSDELADRRKREADLFEIGLAAVGIFVGKLTAHFSLSEFLHSSTAIAKGIKNEADQSAKLKLHRTAEHMERVRALLGDHPIKVTSGYRNRELNEEVGGVPNSDHAVGYAIDFHCPGSGMSAYEICKAIAASDIMNDVHQLIHEFAYYSKSDHTTEWVHISFNSERLARELLTISSVDRQKTRLPGILPVDAKGVIQQP